MGIRERLEEKVRKQIESKVKTKSSEFQEAYYVLTTDRIIPNTPGQGPHGEVTGVMDAIKSVCEKQGKTEYETMQQIVIATAIMKGFDADDVGKYKIREFVTNKMFIGLESAISKMEQTKHTTRLLNYMKSFRETTSDKSLFIQAREEFYKVVLPEVKKVLS